MPIVWKDRDWDYMFLYKILRFKLSNMEECLRNHSHYIGSEKDADKIKICINLIDRIMDDKYYDMVFNKHNKKWGKPEFNWISMKDGPDYSQLEIKRLNVITDKDKEQEKKEYHNLLNIENNLKQQDVDYLFETIRKYHQKWWD